ncbi:MAG: glycosyltransferase family 2 protein [Patescibacteria group bacterium]
MNDIELSYVITTRNKFPYLKGALERLIQNVQEDEEIIVADGGSTDGTKEYLGQLYQAGKIHQFISEPDQNEAHGFNKCFLKARGELIKIISDDDVFYYPAIQECKKFMLEHPEYDLLGTDGVAVHWHHAQPFKKTDFFKQYLSWKDKKTPFAFCGLGLMLRKNSLALTGLFNPFFRNTDGEFTLRTTSTRGINLAWYTGPLWAWILNKKSNTKLLRKRVEQEIDLYSKTYLALTSNKIKSFAKPGLIQSGKIWLWQLSRRVGLKKPFSQDSIPPIDIGYERSYNWLKEEQGKNPGKFL